MSRLAEHFARLQTQLRADLECSVGASSHPGAKGAATEADWLNWLSHRLPWRYQAAHGFVIDSRDGMSDEIDLIIYDRQYSPLLFTQGANCIIPAESVYAVFEVKPALTREYLLYAAEKAASVRRLHRTNAPIVHAGGRIPDPRPPFEILAGIVTYESEWSPPFGEPFRAALRDAPDPGRLDLGCALRHGAFETDCPPGAPGNLTLSGESTALVFFFVRLLARLQALGTVPAIDLDTYAAGIGRTGEIVSVPL